MTTTKLLRISNLMVKRSLVPFIRSPDNGSRLLSTKAERALLSTLSRSATSSRSDDSTWRSQGHRQVLSRSFSGSSMLGNVGSTSVDHNTGQVSHENTEVLTQEEILKAGGQVTSENADALTEEEILKLGGKYAQIKANLPDDLTNYPQEDLYGAIKRMDIQEILTLVSRSYKTIDRIGLAICIKNLHRRMIRIQDEEEKSRMCVQLKNDLAFQMLVACLVKKSKYYNSTIVFDMVEYLYKFNFTSTEFPMKVYLHLSRFHISDMYIDQIVKLAVLANSMPKTKETQLLMEGIQVILSLKQDKITTLTTWEKIHLLDIFGQSLEKGFTRVILRELWLDQEDIRLKFGLYLFKALNQCKYDLPEMYQLFQHCVNIIDQNFDHIHVENLPELLENLKKLSKYHHRKEYTKFLMNSADKLCMGDVFVTIPQKISVLQKLWNANMFHEMLICDILDNLEDGFESILLEAGTSLKLLLCVGLYVSEAPKDLKFLESFDVERFTKTVCSQIDDLKVEQSEDNKEIFEDVSKLHTVICNLWRRKECSVPDWVVQVIGESSSGTEQENRPDLAVVSSGVEADVLAMLNVVAGELDMLLRPANNRPTIPGVTADFELKSNNTSDSAIIPVVFVKSPGYFRNTLQLKRSTEEYIQNIQKNEDKVLMMSPGLLSRFGDQELQKLLTHRIKNIDNFQSMDTWRLNV